MITVTVDAVVDSEALSVHLFSHGISAAITAGPEDTTVTYEGEFPVGYVEGLVSSCPSILQTLVPEDRYDCMKCGACCTTSDNNTSYVYGVVHDGIYNRCEYLSGDVGSSCSCDVYATRPSQCVVFVPGSTGCQKQRIRIGLNPKPDESGG